MPSHEGDELPSLDVTELANVTGGGGFDMSSMLPLFVIMQKRARASAAAATPMPAPTWKPKVTLNGVEQQGTQGANGTTFTTSE
jgi:hypothetical protein